jgi:hypothetical protein
MRQALVELAVQGFSEASHCGIVTGEHLRCDHPLHLVPRRDAVQPGDDDGAHLVPRLLVANVWADRGKGEKSIAPAGSARRIPGLSASLSFLSAVKDFEIGRSNCDKRCRGSRPAASFRI